MIDFTNFINQFPYMDAHEMNLDWILKAMKQLAAEMNDYEAANHISYHGIWENTTQYSAWSIVYADGHLYLSTKPVPAGVDISNTEYWMNVLPFSIDTEFNLNSYNAIANRTVANMKDDLNFKIGKEEADRIEADNSITETLVGYQTQNTRDHQGLADAIAGNTAIISQNTSDIAENAEDISTLTGRVDNLSQTIVPGGTTGDAELADIRLGANGITYPNAGDAVRALDTDNHNFTDDVDNRFLLNKNLVVERVTGKIPTKSGTSIIFTDSDSYNYCIAKVKPGHYYTLNRQVSGNFSMFGSANNTWLANAGTEKTTDAGYVYLAPSNAEYFYIANPDLPADVVLVEGRMDISSGYNTNNHPYNTLVDFTMPKLKLPAIESALVQTLKLKTVLVTNANYSLYLTDLNSVDDNSVYMLFWAASANPVAIAHYPTTNSLGGFQLIKTYTAESDRKTQIVESESGSYIRTYSVNTWSSWTKFSINETEFNNRLSKVYEVGEGCEYTSLKTAIDNAVQYANSIVIVHAGTYDLYDEWGGSAFFDSYDVSQDGGGIELGNGIHLIFDTLAKVVFNYEGSNDNVKEDFSPFNAGRGDFTIENLTLESSNCRYAIHDERSSDPNPYHHKFIHCRIKHDDSNNTVFKNKPCIGGGLASDAEIIIDGCTFEAIADTGDISAVSYHNAGQANAQSYILIKDCYCADHNTISGTARGSSELISEMVITNCSLYTAPHVDWDSDHQPYENMKLTAWNNEIRNT